MPAPLSSGTSDVFMGVEYTEEFQWVDQMVNDHDADAHAPQRQGATPFQWSNVLELCNQLALQCADLRVGIWLLRAAMATHTLAGVSRALRTLATWSELPVEQVFPQGDGADDTRELHVLTLNWLSSPAAIYALGNTTLHTHWGLTLSALVNSQEALTTDPATTAAVLEDAREALSAIESIETHLGQGSSTSTLSLGAALNLLRQAIKRLAPPPSMDEPGAPTSSGPAAALRAPGAPLSNRDEVRGALTDIIDYFKTHEPGHPAPLLLNRVQRMLGASFEDLMRELYQDAPQLVAKLEKPAGH